MISFTKLNLFISVILLFTLITSFNEVNSVAIEKRAGDTFDPINFCKGYEFNLLNDITSTKNNSMISVTWKKGGSQIITVTSVELFTNKGLWATLWDGSESFGPSGTITKTIKIWSPPALSLPNTVMLRSWGTTVKGPNCFKFTKTFTLTK
ncbi:hypothetical protein C1645_883012 [Glomus cerebriforme]|uniref:Reelin domain-containing protein n=1 Tax=Glomus cerebriforme TaxID=658196 RepID=A0A397RX83_9GLOM|nr:hypothetical protein C1645_883012 [Glomus cerebriforme]